MSFKDTIVLQEKLLYSREELKMEAPKIPVQCSVGNCEFNENRMCYAQALEVNASGDGKAATCEGTCCKTFKEAR